MAETDIEPARPVRPPVLARLIAERAAASDTRHALMGDLDEEFLRIARHDTPTRARNWYWRQTLASAPPLIFARIRSNDILAGLVAAIAGFTLISLWTFAVRIFAIRWIAAVSGSQSIPVLRGVYFGLILLGAGLAGALIGRFVFRAERSYVTNLRSRVAPLALVLTLAASATAIARGPDYPLEFQIAILGGSIICLVVGAWAARRR